MPTTFHHSTSNDFASLALSCQIWCGLASDNQIIFSTAQRILFHPHTLSQRLKNGSFPMSDL